MSDKTGPHAISRLSQSLGIPVKKIYDWRDRYEWTNRWLADVHAVSPVTMEIGLATLVQGWPIATARLIQNIEKGSVKDSTNAIRVYAQLTGGDKRAPLAPTAGSRTRIDPALVENVKSLTREQLWELATEAGANNMDRALRERSARRTTDRLNNP
jgi:hypothetical protein